MTAPDELPVPPLARSAVNRAAHHRTDERWLAEAWSRARVLVVEMASGGRALARTGDDSVTLVLLDADAAPRVDPAARLFLGVEPDGTPVFAVDAPLPELPDASPVSLREVGHLLSDRDAGLFTTTAALANWHAGHRYAPATGLPTTAEEGGWSRADGNGNRMWPRTDPAMIVLVHDGVAGPEGRCLLGHNAAWGSNGVIRRFSCLAGYVEPGESAEAAVVREVEEEVGVAVERIDYVGSQSWPFPGSLMLGFHAYADPGQPVRVDPAEIAQARWFSRSEIATVLSGGVVDAGNGERVALPPPVSIAFFLITQWLRAAEPGPHNLGP
ncbi:NAD+ diphosphatase [Micromonospora pattaloongensis]|uniref:NAD(+) diphosphatase n=1 Tax=Micromonospora pattaloongensis TaxID=405436 RepID=A0A1H3G3J7_9ACTN|nr:NAD(+) diphosphatase [Micromonospora pattaloongensis]SDX97831.1 NAD+ diphosphatase [Micromonospora pattaloongensis]